MIARTTRTRISTTASWRRMRGMAEAVGYITVKPDGTIVSVTAEGVTNHQMTPEAREAWDAYRATLPRTAVLGDVGPDVETA